MTLEEAIVHLDESLNDQNHDWGCEECKQEHVQLREWLVELKEMRAVDAVEVVRCRDCKHWNRNMMSGRYPDNVMCKCCESTHNPFIGYTAPDDYCSFAEKR